MTTTKDGVEFTYGMTLYYVDEHDNTVYVIMPGSSFWYPDHVDGEYKSHRGCHSCAEFYGQKCNAYKHVTQVAHDQIESIKRNIELWKLECPDIA
jgi:hypothetical protein